MCVCGGGGGGSFTIPGQRPVMLKISTSDIGTKKLVGALRSELKIKNKVIRGTAKENVH